MMKPGSGKERRLVPPVERDWRRLVRTAIRLLAALILLPNLLFWALEAWLALPRPALNLDYALVALLFPWLGGAGGAVVASVIALTEAVVAGAYHFCGNPSCLIQAAPEVTYLPLSYTLPIAAGLLTTAAALGGAVYSALRHTPRRSGPNLLAAGAAVLLGVALTPLSPAPKQDEHAVVFGDFLDNTLIPAIAWATEFRGIEARPVPAATSPLFAALHDGTPLPERVILVMVESWGKFQDSRLQARTTRAFDGLGLDSLYRVERGAVPQFGATVKGELRELCLAQSASLRPDPALLPIDDCLPQLFNARGYTTRALHGFRSDYFDRQTWWPALGFDHVLFRREIAGALDVTRSCGTIWEGVCDPDAVALLRTYLAEPGDAAEPQFIYWLTLNSHGPYTRDETLDDPARSCDLDPTICTFLGRHEPAMEAVARLAAEQVDGRTAWIIVGDHPPRFSTQKLQDLVSADSVPWIRLWPRDAVATDTPVANPTPGRAAGTP